MQILSVIHPKPNKVNQRAELVNQHANCRNDYCLVWVLTLE